VCHAFCLDPRDPEGADGTAERSEQSKVPNNTAAGCAPSRQPLDRIDPPPPLTPPARSMRSGTAPLLRAAAARAEHRRKCAAEKARNLVVPGGGVERGEAPRACALRLNRQMAGQGRFARPALL